MSDTQYIVSARKYRPATFASVVGQKTLTATLKNSIQSNRVAQAYLFCGPRGVGKTSCARIFAKTINCTNLTPEGEACGTCESCQAIAKGNSFNLIELDAASNNSVDDIRTLIEQVNVPPQQGRYKVFIIDEVHMLSSQAFNAFLKTLEEPPKYAVFILATTEKHKVIPTILSRCQIYDFKRITVEDAVEHLKYVAADKGIKADPRALGVIARKADGAMRDALSIFDQVAASSFGDITYESAIENLNVLDYDFYFRLVDAFAAGDVQQSLIIYKEIRDKGFDSLFFINGLASHVRDLMVAADPRTLPLLEVDAQTAETYRAQTSKLPLQWYYAAMKILNNADYSYRTSGSKQLLVEVSLIRLCQLLNPATPPFDLAEDLPSLRNPFTAPTSAPQEHAASSAESAPAVNPHPQLSAEVEAPRTGEALPAGTAAAAPKQHSVGSTSAQSPAPAHTTAGTKGRPSAFRLSDMNATTEATTKDLRNASYTEEELSAAWGEFILKHPNMHILLSVMRSARRECIAPHTYRFIVSHPSEHSTLESGLFEIATFLRNKLHNDHITLEVAVDPNAEIEKRATPQEFLKNIMAENPHLAEFLMQVEAEIANI